MSMEQKKQKEILSKILSLAKKKYIKEMELEEKEQLPEIEDLLINELD